MRRALALILCLLTTPASGESPPSGESIVSGLSESRVSIDANFVGTDISVYGAVKLEEVAPSWPLLQVIITVEGPSAAITVRRKERVAGIWLNRGALQVDDVPSFYAIATTGDLADILSKDEDARYNITLGHRRNAFLAAASGADAAAYVDAINRLHLADHSYRLARNSVLLLEQSLFRTDIALPSNLTEGKYKVSIFLTRGGKVVDSQTSQIDVQKAGLERFLFTLAQEQPLLYGLVSLALAIAAGWGASAMFQRLRL